MNQIYKMLNDHNVNKNMISRNEVFNILK